MTREKRVQIWLQLSYLASVESDAICYAWPRPSGPDVDEHLTMLKDAGDRFYEKAKEVSGGTLDDEAWRAAIDALGRTT